MIILMVNDKDIRTKQTELLTTNCVGLPSIAFEFDESWETLTKTAVFKNGKQAENYKVLLEEIDECIVPHEVLKTVGNLEVSVFGIYYNEIIKTTHYINVGTVYQGADTDAGEPLEHTPSLYEQVVTLMERQAVDAVTATQASATSVTKAGEASTSADNAHTSEVNAKSSEDKAKISETNAGESAIIASNNILNGVSNHNAAETSHPSLLSAISHAEAIARGRATAFSFASYTEIQAWFNGTYVYPDGRTPVDLIIGDNIYDETVGVPDYWWNGTQLMELGAETPDLSAYYTKSEVDSRLPITIEQTDYDALVLAGTVIAGRIYYVVPDGVLE